MNELPIPAFEHAIQAIQAARSRLLASERVVEQFRGERVWEGDVLVFESVGHKTAPKWYAWSVDGRVTAVLHEPPVDSPVAAVRAAIREENQEWVTSRTAPKV